MVRTVVVVKIAFVLAFSIASHAQCPRFNASTMQANGVPAAGWRTDYPRDVTDVSAPWLKVDFVSKPKEYMGAVLQTVRNEFVRSEGDLRLKGTGKEQWWISLWLDYSNSGREPLMGLTKERGPHPGDLSGDHADGYQVWAVGFYNSLGAVVLGNVFKDPCDPTFPTAVDFPEGTASVKFLFSDASPDEVTYLKGAPTYEAFIDKAGAGRRGAPAEKRTKRILRLLQVDIAAKDPDAEITKWVFGTFVWMGPTRGDGLFDNLVPVSLQWGNDPGVYDTHIGESWINPALEGVLYGWPARPHLGFNGRANGPADNIRSSCLSCHAAARVARSEEGILGSGFDMKNDIGDKRKVREHVDRWFENLPSGEFFDPSSERPKVAALDYSLQLEAAAWRMCRACQDGALTGATPGICRSARLFDRPVCGSSARTMSQHGGVRDAMHLDLLRDVTAPPRQ